MKIKINKKIYFLICSCSAITFLYSCKGASSTSENNLLNTYNYEVLYDYQGKSRLSDKYRYKWSDDNLYIVFESYFLNDTIEINTSMKESVKEIVTTEEVSGVAKNLIFKKIDLLEWIKIRINHGPWILIQIQTENNIIGVRTVTDKYQFVMYKESPIYY